MFIKLFWCVIYSYFFIDCKYSVHARPSSLKLDDPLKNIPCDFENGLCPGYEVDKSADFEWTWKSGPSNSILTGPNGDNTPNKNGKGYYVHIESANRFNGDQARLMSRILDHKKTKGQKLCLQFFYHMNGHTMGEFSVRILTVNDDIEKIEFLVNGNQKHTTWQKGQFSFDTPNQPYKIIFQGKTSFGIYGDMGLDDINLTSTKDGLCDFWPTNATSGQAIQSITTKAAARKAAPPPPASPPINKQNHPEDKKTCGRSNEKLPRIILGLPVTPIGKWPWMAMLQRLNDENKFDHVCGGTLLANRWIITAAHCVIDLNNTSHIRVRLGTHRRNAKEPNTQEINVNRIFVHPEYSISAPLDKDIALLELTRPAIINNYVQSICLMENTQLEQNSTCIVTGWGRLWGKDPNDKAPQFADILNEASVDIKERKDCLNNFRTGQITDNMLCAKGRNGFADTCEGDSGGPLMCQSKSESWSLVGITSSGHKDGCGIAGKYGIYTRMSKLNDWVINTTANPHLAKSLL